MTGHTPALTLAPADAPAPAARPHSQPVFDAPPGSELELSRLIAVTAVDGYDDPDDLAVKVLARVDEQQLRVVLLQAVTQICRLRYSRHEPSPSPQPRHEPPPLPAIGPVRKVVASDVLQHLPQRLLSKVNIGSTRTPEWKLLGDCTASDLVTAIGIRQELSRLHAAEADFYVLLLDEMTETDTPTVKGLLRLEGQKAG